MNRRVYSSNRNFFNCDSISEVCEYVWDEDEGLGVGSLITVYEGRIDESIPAESYGVTDIVPIEIRFTNDVGDWELEWVEEFA